MKIENQLLQPEDVDIEQTFSDMEIIRRYAMRIKSPSCFVEIGTMYGGSALVARRATKIDVKVYSIDPSSDFSKWNGTQNDYEIDFIKGYSLEVARNWKKPIGVLFIDGNHDQAQQDFGAWEKYIIKGGYVLFHDYAFHSPKVIQDCNFGMVSNEKFYRILDKPASLKKSPFSIFQAKKL